MKRGAKLATTIGGEDSVRLALPAFSAIYLALIEILQEFFLLDKLID